MMARELAHNVAYFIIATIIAGGGALAFALVLGRPFGETIDTLWPFSAAVFGLVLVRTVWIAVRTWHRVARLALAPTSSRKPLAVRVSFTAPRAVEMSSVTATLGSPEKVTILVETPTRLDLEWERSDGRLHLWLACSVTDTATQVDLSVEASEPGDWKTSFSAALDAAWDVAQSLSDIDLIPARTQKPTP
ncbi:MAG TPA: hypothetical protein VIS06_11275 [Mycobacteriales bacterium]